MELRGFPITGAIALLGRKLAGLHESRRTDEGLYRAVDPLIFMRAFAVMNEDTEASARALADAPLP